MGGTEGGLTRPGKQAAEEEGSSANNTWPARPGSAQKQVHPPPAGCASLTKRAQGAGSDAGNEHFHRDPQQAEEQHVGPAHGATVPCSAHAGTWHGWGVAQSQRWDGQGRRACTGKHNCMHSWCQDVQQAAAHLGSQAPSLRIQQPPPPAPSPPLHLPKLAA